MKSISRGGRTVSALAALSLAIICATALVHTGHAAAAEAKAHPAITITNYSFHPATLTVRRGTTVVWVNKDDDVHTIKSTDGPAAFSSPALDNGSQYKVTFHHKGTYHYICSVHPYMHGVIVVR